MINPSRIEFARVRRQWTKARLASALGVNSRSIQGYESGEYAPDQEKLRKLSELLDFPEAFFFQDDLPQIPEHGASFRSMSKLTAMLKASALNAGSIAFELNKWIECRFVLPQPDLPDLSDLPPEEAALTLRRIWGIGDAPIGNIVNLLESKGIRVYSLALEAKEVDAYSVWHEGRPFVFLNTFKSAEHSRFDAAHELKHLVCDRHSMLHGIESSPQMEKDANAFASAFLMPRNSVIAAKPAFLSVPSLITYKKVWGVSLAAMAYRLNTLKQFTEWAYRGICIEIAKNGYRTSEPEPMQREVSQVLGKVFAALRKEGITMRDVAAQLHVPVTDLEALTFGLVMGAVSKPGAQTLAHESDSVQSAARPSLRLV